MDWTRKLNPVTAFLHYRAEDTRTAAPALLFDGVAKPTDQLVSGGLLHARGESLKTLRFLARNASGELGCCHLHGALRLRKSDDATGAAWKPNSLAQVNGPRSPDSPFCPASRASIVSRTLSGPTGSACSLTKKQRRRLL